MIDDMDRPSKIYPQGNSYVISISRPFMKRHGLKKGDLVAIVKLKKFALVEVDTENSQSKLGDSK